MAVSVIPFSMPQPQELPAQLADSLRQIPQAEAVQQVMKLLLQIDAAQAILYEAVDENGNLALEQVASQEGGAELAPLLKADPHYGRPVTPEGSYLPGRSRAAASPLLVMGQAEAGEAMPLSPGLARWALGEGESGNVGFIYVLPVVEPGQTGAAWLTLLRPASAGPLNHEQPNIAEALRRILSEIRAAAA